MRINGCINGYMNKTISCFLNVHKLSLTLILNLMKGMVDECAYEFSKVLQKKD